MSAKVPGDGKIRESVAKDVMEAEQLVMGVKDAVEAQEGVEKAFSAYKKALRTVYDQMGKKARNNSTIASSQEVVDSVARQVSVLGSLDVSAYPKVARDLDPMDGEVAEMLQVCRRTMVVANKTQTAKGQRADA
jgi:hypothetical protein